MFSQLSLPVRLNDEATFANFYAGNNQKLINYLQDWLAGQVGQYAYLYGHTGNGCSHLLQACYHQLHTQTIPAIYLQLTEIDLLSPAIFFDLEKFNFVLLDDIHTLAGKLEWEEALFHLFNRLQLTENRLLVGAHAVPSFYPWVLPDLKSRLLSNLVLPIKSLNDSDKLAALQWRASQRGLNLNNETAKFLIHHIARDFKNLLHVLDKLDKASLQTKRRLTVPFIKKVLQIN